MDRKNVYSRAFQAKKRLVADKPKEERLEACRAAGKRAVEEWEAQETKKTKKEARLHISPGLRSSCSVFVPWPAEPQKRSKIVSIPTF